MDAFEEDEDETMHVDANTVALNQDIQEACSMRGANQKPLAVGINNEHPMTSGMSNQPVFNFSSQKAMSMGGDNQQAKKLSNHGLKVPYTTLLPVIRSLLDRDRTMQLETLYKLFQSNKITKEDFVPLMRTLVGDQVISMAGYKLQQQNTRDAAAQQHMQAPSNVPAESSDCTLNHNPFQQYEVGRQGGSHTMQATQMSLPYLNVSSHLKVPFAPSPIAAANSARTPIKKTPVGQKKPLEALGSSPSPSSKKQKVSGGTFLDQSIEQLNDVTAAGGVNLTEEEEKLFSGPKEDGQVSEASRRVVQEEEDRLILPKIPLQKKLAQIMAKSGLKSIGSNVEKCLSLCFEERMRGLMSSLIRLSKQRVDIEKLRHRTFITTDVRKKIMSINQKVRVEWEKKQTEEETLVRLNEKEGNTALDIDKENDESHASPGKIVANKEEDENRSTTAANVAARAALGGDDMVSKWQLMAEQARQKLEGGTDGLSGSQAGKDVSRKNSAAGKSERDHHEAGKRGQSTSTPGSIRKLGRNQVIGAHNRVARAISIKDVIAVLEREVQMSKSTLMYSLYSEIHSESSAHSAD